MIYHKKEEKTRNTDQKTINNLNICIYQYLKLNIDKYIIRQKKTDKHANKSFRLVLLPLIWQQRWVEGGG